MQRETNWPENFLSELAPNGFAGVIRGEEAWATLEYLLALYGCQRDANVVLSYYRDGKTYREIGVEIGKSHERVRQIIREVICYLRHPRCRGLIEFGLKGYLDKIAGKAWQDGYVAGVHAGEELASVAPQLLSVLDPQALSTPVEHIGLSRRSSNALRRFGIHTLADLAAFPNKKLSDVRGLGAKGKEEIRAIIDCWLVQASAS